MSRKRKELPPIPATKSDFVMIRADQQLRRGSATIGKYQNFAVSPEIDFTLPRTDGTISLQELLQSPKITTSIDSFPRKHSRRD